MVDPIPRISHGKAARARSLWRTVLLGCLVVLLAGCRVDLPYSNGFEPKASKVPGETVGDSSDLEYHGAWAAVRSSTGWPSRSGNYHLDSNPLGLRILVAVHPEQAAQFRGTLNVPTTGGTPYLTFWHKFTLAENDDEFLVQLAIPNERNWHTVASFRKADGVGQYTQVRIPLSAYRGKEVGLRFTQRILRPSLGLRRWAIDDLRVYAEPGSIQSLNAVQEGRSVRLSWTGAGGVSGYVIRRQAGNEPAQRLGQVGATAQEYVDTTPANGTGYRYSVAPLDESGQEGEAAAAQVFVAYHDAAVQGLTVQREGWDGRLRWTAQPGTRVRLYRAARAEAQPALLAEVAADSHLDVRPGWQAPSYYWAESLRDFTNPFTGAQFTLAGPRSGPVVLVALPPLGATLTGLRGSAADGYDLIWNGEAHVVVNGEYRDAVGPVEVVASGSGSPVRSTAADGGFRLVLPVTAAANWQIVVSEQGEPSRAVALALRIAGDTRPPQVSINGPATLSTTAETISLQGTALDAESGLAGVSIISSRFTGSAFQAFTGAGGSFEADVPLLPGLNLITVIARDRAGNVASAQVEVTRQIGALPRLEIVQPVNGSVVQAESVTVAGVVYSSQAASNLRLTLGGEVLFPTTSNAPGVHSFAFPGVRLNQGANQILVTVESPQGTDQAVVVVTRGESTEAEPTPPQIDITAPTHADYTNQDQVTVAGTARSSAGIASVSINGQPVAVSGADNKSVAFRQTVPVSEETAIEIVARDVNGLTSSRTITLRRDSEPPQVRLFNTDLQTGGVSMVRSNPYRLSGTVTDPNLAGLTLNGQNTGLLPGTEPNSYQFDAVLNLGAGQPVTVTLDAWDQARNRTVLEYVLQLDAAVAIDILSPREGAELEGAGDQVTVPVIARLGTLAAGHTVSARVGGGQPATLTLDEGVGRASLSLPAVDAAHELLVEVRNEAGTVVAAARRQFRVVNLDLIPLALERATPENGAAGIEPNEPITLIFNKPIVPAKLQVLVTETVHGHTYDLSANTGKNALHTGGSAPIVEVHRDHAPVAGNLSVLPDGRGAAFYMEREFAYGAQVLVDVIYDGGSLARFGYQVRPLPTLLSGLVVDQLGQPVPGITVSLPALNRSTRTDQNGTFSFGYGESAANGLKGGRQRLVLNPGLRDVRFGTLEQWVSIEEGRATRLAALPLAALSPEIAFQRVQSGQPDVSLAQGELRLDLSQARLVFVNGRDNGDLHVQFATRAEVPYRAPQPSVNPLWLYALQPGARVEGSVGISIAMPSLRGSYDYIPADGTLVLLVGFEPDELRLVPVGVGRIEQRRVVSEGRVALPALNYLGYVLVDEARQQLLARYRNGELSLEQLLAELDKQS